MQSFGPEKLLANGRARQNNANGAYDTHNNGRSDPLGSGFFPEQQHEIKGDLPRPHMRGQRTMSRCVETLRFFEVLP